MLKIKFESFEELSSEEKESAPNNGTGKEYCTYIRVTHNDKTVRLESDAMEPEDCTFGRDLSWIANAIQEAYEIGLGEPL